MRSTTTAASAEATPLGPDSLTWKYFGDYVTRHKSFVARAESLVHTTFSLAGLRPARGRSTAA